MQHTSSTNPIRTGPHVYSDYPRTTSGTNVHSQKSAPAPASVPSPSTHATECLRTWLHPYGSARGRGLSVEWDETMAQKQVPRRSSGRGHCFLWCSFVLHRALHNYFYAHCPRTNTAEERIMQTYFTASTVPGPMSDPHRPLAR